MSLKIYKASAGSGKTYQLSLEYICLALKPKMPNAFTHILAVTFTNKATGEMKSRILSYLYDLAYLHNEKDFMNQVAERLDMGENEVAYWAKKVLKAILNDYDHFRVETIDSFLQSMLSGLAYELGLSRHFKVDLDVNDIVSRAVDRMLLKAGNSDENQKRVGDFVRKYMEDKIEDGKGWGIARDLKTFAQNQLFREDYLNKEKELTDFLHDNEKFNAFYKELRQRLNKYEAILTQGAEALQDLLNAHAETPGLKNLKTLTTYTNKLLAKEYKEEPKNTVINAYNDHDTLIKANLKKRDQAERAAKEIVETLRTVEDARQKLVQEILTLRVTLHNLLPLCLLNEIGCEVSDLNKETDTFMLGRTPDFFAKSVKQNDSSFIFERAGTTFNHVMIDEFQDTSLMQWDIFRELLLENIAQGEENLIVGDVKQSIYRFRGGDWKILHGLEEEMKNRGPVELYNLKTNYRSRREVVKFNNELFQRAASQLDRLNEEDGYDKEGKLVGDIYRGVEQAVKPKNSEGGYVCVTLMNSETKKKSDKQSSEKCSTSQADVASEEPIDEVVSMRLQGVHDAIINLHNEQQVPYDQMIILVRRNKEATQLIDFFSTNYPGEVPLTSDEAFRLSASPAVMMLISALKYIADPEKNSTARELYEKMGQQLTDAGYPVQQLDGQYLISQRAELLAMPLYELCQRLIQLFDLPKAERAGAGQSASLFYFLDSTLSFLDDHASNLPDFIDHWDNTLSKKYITANAHDSVRIMTIHKAKGLQKHTVLIPFCEWELDKDRSNDILWCETDEAGAPIDVLPLVPVNTQALKRTKYENSYQADHLNQRIDSFNMCYVALTRAESNLLIWAEGSTTGKDNSVKKLLDAYIEESGAESCDPQTVEGKKKIITSTTYRFGSPVAYKSKADNEPTTDSEPNPLEIKHSAVEAITLTKSGLENNSEQATTNLLEVAHDTNTPTPSSQASQIRFRQSNEATRFVRSLDDDADISQHDYILRGKLYHYILSLIRTTDDLTRAIATAEAKGLFTSDEDQQHTLHDIRKRLADPVAAQWFDGSWQVFTESDIITPQSDDKADSTHLDHKTKRPDRVMVRPDATIVVDYKTGVFRQENDEQVREYMALLSQMGYNNIKGYLWMLATGEIREVKA